MLLLPNAALAERRGLAAPGGPLAPLAESLAADLAPVVARPVWLPPEKARLSRTGGRCPRDGTLLTFDPTSPRRHACPRCGGTYDDEAHYRWWIMGYHLWLAERAVHAAVLHAVLGDPGHAAFAARVLDAYADAYLDYPNRDNVLGPTRPFFSTYLESLWLLHVCVALDALRAARAPGVRALSARLKDRVIEPSRALVASYHEGHSNRQVWNAAAWFAASSLLGRRGALRGAGTQAPLGFPAFAARACDALLADGSWVEGDNYHQFAHRGLWYALLLGARGGWDAGPELARRFALGFAAPFRVALPDLTLPARRDSQYGVSLRQWRWAEWCELGLAWPGAGDETRRALGGALAGLYDPDAAPAGDTGRWRATGESERNERPVALTRAALGWKSLLFAAPEPALAAPEPPRSVLLEAQGLAVFRRDAGRLWVGVDFGATGGGHGHPDRLNLLLADGPTRWLDDMGTGSYTERALHWYRSTLAHHAPLVHGRSQPRVPGHLLAYEERPPYGWTDAAVALGDGVEARRAVVVADAYVVDLLTWRAGRPVTLDLPFHVDAEVMPSPAWIPAALDGAGGLEDGFDFLRDVERVDTPDGPGPVASRLIARPPTGEVTDATRLDGWVRTGGAATWFRALAPGPPGAGDRRFLLLRSEGAEGWSAVVWSPRGAVQGVDVRVGWRKASPTVVVRLRSGAVETHRRDGARWRIERSSAARRDEGRADDGRLLLGDARPTNAHAAPEGAAAGRTRAWYGPPTPARWASTSRVRDADAQPAGTYDLAIRADGRPVVVRLGKGDYRRSEPSWREAGRPRAVVRLSARSGELQVRVDVRLGRPAYRRPASLPNDMDNERADVNADGVQLFLRPAGGDAMAGWLLVPDDADGAVRATPLAGALPLAARCTPHAAGWQLAVSVPRVALGVGRAGGVVGFDLVVNEMPPGRERRQGQLVFSGAYREHVYLRGDRQDPGALVRVLVPAIGKSV